MWRQKCRAVAEPNMLSIKKWGIGLTLAGLNALSASLHRLPLALPSTKFCFVFPAWSRLKHLTACLTRQLHFSSLPIPVVFATLLRYFQTFIPSNLKPFLTLVNRNKIRMVIVLMARHAQLKPILRRLFVLLRLVCPLNNTFRTPYSTVLAGDGHPPYSSNPTMQTVIRNLTGLVFTFIPRLASFFKRSGVGFVTYFKLSRICLHTFTIA